MMVNFARQCGQAFHRTKLHEEAQVVAAVQERQRLARELHESVSQLLVAMMAIAEAGRDGWERNPQRTGERLAQIVEISQAALAEMRALLLELHPEAVFNSTLPELLGSLVRAAKGRQPIKAQLVIDGSEQPLPPEVLVALYRVAQESISNVLKHSRATDLRVYLLNGPNRITLRISDNGCGFDAQQTLPGVGLRSMHERAEAIGTTFSISRAIGQGTDVQISWQRTAT